MLLQGGELGQRGELLLPGGPKLGPQAALQLQSGAPARPQGKDQRKGDQDHHEAAQQQLGSAHPILIRLLIP